MRDITAREDAGVRLTAVVAASIGLVLLFGDVTGIDALVRLSGAAVLAVALLRWLDEAHHELTGVVVALWVAPSHGWAMRKFGGTDATLRGGLTAAVAVATLLALFVPASTPAAAKAD